MQSIKGGVPKGKQRKNKQHYFFIQEKTHYYMFHCFDVVNTRNYKKGYQIVT